jgi:hypothetical protein
MEVRNMNQKGFQLDYKLPESKVTAGYRPIQEKQSSRNAIFIVRVQLRALGL